MQNKTANKETIFYRVNNYIFRKQFEYLANVSYPENENNFYYEQYYKGKKPIRSFCWFCWGFFIRLLIQHFLITCKYLKVLVSIFKRDCLKIWRGLSSLSHFGSPPCPAEPENIIFFKILTILHKCTEIFSIKTIKKFYMR